MTDTDRRLDDIEKRLARLERAAEQKPVVYPAKQWRTMSGRMDVPEAEHSMGKPLFEEQTNVSQFCPCGRDICRAPDCPSHRNDPLGR